jgi:Putative Flp pilus-assembly TadE/G-like
MKRRREAGQALYITAAALVVLMGFMGLGLDMGVLRYEKRLQQTAADAAAVAGANNLPYGGVTAGAQNAAATNGFTDNGGGQVSDCGSTAAIGTVCVQINNPPLSGPHTGDANYVEALVAAVQPTYFMTILGITQESITARAVATNVSGGAGSGCLYTLGSPTNSIEGVNINGNATLNAPTCGILDNGNYNTKGNALDVTANTFGVSGSAEVSGPGGTVVCTTGQNPCPAYGMPAAADPLGYLTPPAVGTPVNWTGTAVPGTTYSGITITGNGSVNFPAGIYTLTGDFTCHGTPTITGTGVMFYFTNGATFNCSGNDTIQFTAPSASNCPACPSQYDGILFYQDPNDTNGPSLGGNTGSYYDGGLYFPKSEVTFFGNATSVNVGIIVGAAFALSGHPTVNVLGVGGLPPGVNLVSNAILVE